MEENKNANSTQLPEPDLIDEVSPKTHENLATLSDLLLHATPVGK